MNKKDGSTFGLFPACGIRSRVTAEAVAGNVLSRTDGASSAHAEPPHLTVLGRLTSRSGSGKAALATVAVGAGVFGLGLTAIAFAPQGSAVAAFWPAGGVSVAAVSATRGSRRAGLLTVIALATFLANLAAGRPLVLASLLTISNVAEAALVGCWLGHRGRPSLQTLRELGRLLVAASAGGALVGAAIAVSVWALKGAPLWSTWWSVAAAHSAAVLLVLPLVARPPVHAVRVHRWESVAQWAATLIVLAVVFSPGQQLPLAFLVLVFPVWAGLRAGVRPAAVQVLVVGAAATALTALGGGPFAQAGRVVSPLVAGALMQLFLLLCGLVVLTVAVTVGQREAALAELVTSRQFLDVLVDTLDVGVIAVDALGRPTLFNRLTREMHGPVTDGVGGESPIPGGWCRAQDVPRRFSLLRSDGSGPLPLADVPITRVLADGQLHGAELIVAREGYPTRHLVVHGRQIRAADGTLLGAVTAAHDVTELKRREAELEVAVSALADQREFDRALLEVVDVGVAACDVDGALVICNAAHRQMTGIRDIGLPTAGQVRAGGLTLLAPDGNALAWEQWPLQRALAGEALTNSPIRLAVQDRALCQVLVTARQIHGADGRLLGAVAASTDVTAERAAQDRLREGAAFHDAVLAASPDFIYVIDAVSNVVIWGSRNLTVLLGYNEQQVKDLGKQVVAAIVHPDDTHRLEEANAAARKLPDGEVLSIRYRLKNSAGQWRWFSRRITPFVRDSLGQVEQLLGVARDITDTVEVENHLTQIALHDALTGLPNRRLLSDRLAIAVNGTARGGGQVTVLFCDLDGFKHVNDTAGHDAGDQLLVAVSGRLRDAVRPEDTVARVGGDEFVVVLGPGRAGSQQSGPPDATDPNDVQRTARAVAERITRAVSEPIILDGTAHVVTVSIGVAFAQDGDDPETTLRDADSAMYQAKALGKDRLAMFDSGLRESAVEHGRVERLLRASLSLTTPAGPPAAGEHGLSVAYQPIMDLGTQRLIAVEALARLTDPHGLNVPPDTFIPVAEETRLIGPVGQRILDTACRDLARWHARHPGWRNLELSVNLSARQLGLTDVVADVEDTLRRHNLAAGLLTLELTESVLLEAGQPTMAALRELRALGIKIVIDDFGTGYASLRYLAEFPVTGVKIDRSFIAGLPNDPTSSTIVRAIASLARDLGLTCVAEGIETDAQLLALPAGIAGQGYLLGRPTTGLGLEERLTETGARPAAERPKPATRS